MGRALPCSTKGLRLKATELARWVQHISTPLEASFQDEFVAALNIPHSRDAFPSLAGIFLMPEMTTKGAGNVPARANGPEPENYPNPNKNTWSKPQMSEDIDITQMQTPEICSS
jgi:hypothetical protein